MLAAQPTSKLLALIDGYLRGGALATPSVGLFTGSPALSEATVLADLSEPLFTGYARVPVTLESIRRTINGDFVEAYQSANFQPSAGTLLPETSSGVFLVATIATVTHLLWAEHFASPFVFADQYTGLDVIVAGMVRNGLLWGGICGTCG